MQLWFVQQVVKAAAKSTCKSLLSISLFKFIVVAAKAEKDSVQTKRRCMSSFLMYALHRDAVIKSVFNTFIMIQILFCLQLVQPFFKKGSSWNNQSRSSASNRECSNTAFASCQPPNPWLAATTKHVIGPCWLIMGGQLVIMVMSQFQHSPRGVAYAHKL